MREGENTHLIPALKELNLNRKYFKNQLSVLDYIFWIKSL